MRVGLCMKTVKAFGKIVSFNDDTPEDEIKQALERLNPDYAINANNKAIEALRSEVRSASEDSTRALVSAHKSACEEIKRAIEANKPKDPIQYKEFRATKIAEGDFRVVLEV